MHVAKPKVVQHRGGEGVRLCYRKRVVIGPTELFTGGPHYKVIVGIGTGLPVKHTENAIGMGQDIVDPGIVPIQGVAGGSIEVISVCADRSSGARGRGCGVYRKEVLRDRANVPRDVVERNRGGRAREMNLATGAQATAGSIKPR